MLQYIFCISFGAFNTHQPAVYLIVSKVLIESCMIRVIEFRLSLHGFLVTAWLIFAANRLFYLTIRVFVDYKSIKQSGLCIAAMEGE